jgi:hypothetical protein
MASTKKINSETEIKSKSIELNIERSIDLDPKDWYWATWRNLPPLQRQEPKLFDLQDCLKRLRQVTEHWDWEKAKIADILSCAEAHFWFTARLDAKRELERKRFFDPNDLADRLSSYVFDGNILSDDVEYFCARLHGYSDSGAKEMMILLNILDLKYLTIFCNKIDRKTLIMYGFQLIVRPYLTPSQTIELEDFLRPRLDPTIWSTLPPYTEPPVEFFLAAGIGMNNELLALIESWDDDAFRKSKYCIHYQKPQEIVFGLKDPELIRYHFNRLGLSLRSPNCIVQRSAYIRAWLTHTEYSSLDLIRDAILSIGEKQNAQEMMKTFALVKAPEVAPFMLELMISSKAAQIAKYWLEDNPSHAIMGLIPVAVNKGKYKDAAIDFLRSMKRQGYGEYIKSCCERESPEIATQIQSAILDIEEKQYIKFDRETTPAWLSQAIATIDKPARKKKQQISSDILPPLICGDRCLNDEQLEAVINALRQSTLASPHPLVIALKTYDDSVELAEFVWQIFEGWMVEGAAFKDSWKITAIGLLGNEDSARKLVPLIKNWSSKTQHSRVKLGLASLHAIGSDVAVSLMNDLSQQSRFTGIQERALTYMCQIAENRDMTRSQLADRLIPDCNLNDIGTRMFDFGDRQFWFVVSKDLKPMLKDTANKLQSNLPKPNRKYRKDKAEAAIDEWKILKQQVIELFKIQSMRLERAMLSHRRWEITEFETLLVRHPLMNHLTQLMVWGGYDKGGHLIGTFHVTEDRTYADEKDLTCELTRFDRIGIVHPDEFSPKLLTIWGELMSDYKIISPFVQLGRSIGD